MDAIFPSPYCLIFLYLYFLLQSLDEEDTALARWPELTALPTSIFAEMIGLARDETPPSFGHATKGHCHWFGDQMMAMSYTR